jgi:hypothetical protein
MAKTGRKLIIGCMDWRYNGIIDGLADGTSVVLRNGGANAEGLESSIRKALELYPDITEIHIMPHEDCAAMKFVRNVLDGNEEAGELLQPLVDEFAGCGTEDIFEYNRDYQPEALIRIVEEAINGRKTGIGGRTYVVGSDGRRIEIKTDYISLGEMPTAKGHEHNACIIVDPFFKKTEDMAKAIGVNAEGMYVAQVLDPDNVIADVDLILKRVHPEKITLLKTGAMKEEEYERVLDLMRETFKELDVVDFGSASIKKGETEEKPKADRHVRKNK